MLPGFVTDQTRKRIRPGTRRIFLRVFLGGVAYLAAGALMVWLRDTFAPEVTGGRWFGLCVGVYVVTLVIKPIYYLTFPDDPSSSPLTPGPRPVLREFIRLMWFALVAWIGASGSGEPVWQRAAFVAGMMAIFAILALYYAYLANRGDLPESDGT